MNRNSSSGIVAVIGAGGAQGGALLEALLRKKEAGTLDYRIGVCSRNEKVRAGDLRGKPQSNNLGVEVRDMISPELKQDVVVYSRVLDVLGDDDVEAALNALPSSMHVEANDKLLAASIHTFGEKPFSLEPDADAIRLATRTLSGTRLCVGQILPFFPQFAAAHRLLASGKLGETKRVSMGRMVEFGNPHNHPSQKKLIRSMFFDLAVHDLHFCLLNWGRPKAIQVMEASRHPDDKEMVMRARAVLHYDGLDNCEIHCGAWDKNTDRPAFQHWFEFKCHDGSMVFMPDRNGGAATLIDSVGTGLLVGDPQHSHRPDIAPIALEIEHFLAAAFGGKELGPLDPALAFDAVVVADAIEKAVLAKTSRRIEVEFPT